MKKFKKFSEKACLVSQFYLSTTLRELKKGMPCYAFNNHQVEKIKELYPEITIKKEVWYTIMQKKEKTI